MTQIVQNRSEIVFITDARDCNPNGDPLSDGRPRIDPVTEQAVITDVRLKRYLRDQLVADGHDIFVRKTGSRTGVSRAQLALDVLNEIETVDDLEQIPDVEAAFLANATDVRYFGATLSFNRDPENELHAAIRDVFQRGQYTGPVQFSPARSLNAVEMNEETNAITSVIAPREDATAGGFALNDFRIKYGIFPFHGLIDEHGAIDTGLTERDVMRLDTLCWRALKNQSITRSKLGQEPRLYLRVEYNQSGYHDGGLHDGVSLARETATGESASETDEPLRKVTDVSLDVTTLVDRLGSQSDRIETVHLVGDAYLTIGYDGTEVGPASELATLLTERGVDVHEIDVYEEFTETLPEDATDDT